MNAIAHERKTMWTLREAVGAFIWECQNKARDAQTKARTNNESDDGRSA